MDPDLPQGAGCHRRERRRGGDRHDLTSRPQGKPVRKDKIVLEERGLYVESWLPEHRSRRRPIYYLHGELGRLLALGAVPALLRAARLGRVTP